MRVPQAIEIVMDVADPRSIEEMARTVLDRFGRNDVLVNNAAVAAVHPLRCHRRSRVGPPDVRQRQGHVAVFEAVVPAMRAQGRGRIINMSSDTVWSGVPMMLHYVTRKARSSR